MESTNSDLQIHIPCEDHCSTGCFSAYQMLTFSVIDFNTRFCYNELTAKQEFIKENNYEICVEKMRRYRYSFYL